MEFVSEIKGGASPARVYAVSLSHCRDTRIEAEQTLHMRSGESITIMVEGPHGEVRALRLSAKGSLSMFEDLKSGDVMLVRRTKNISIIGDNVTTGEDQIV